LSLPLVEVKMEYLLVVLVAVQYTVEDTPHNIPVIQNPAGLGNHKVDYNLTLTNFSLPNENFSIY
jgi:hypothetical protein